MTSQYKDILHFYVVRRKVLLLRHGHMRGTESSTNVFLTYDVNLILTIYYNQKL